MLSNRQIRLLQILEDSNETTSSSTIAKALNVSTRTIMNDIKQINTLIDKSKSEIITISGKGYKLKINNNVEFSRIIKKSLVTFIHNSSDMNNRQNRVNYILIQLFLASDPIKAEDLASELFVSSSSIQIDIKEARKLLKKYNLKLVNIYNVGMIIEGTEENKRSCIIKENFSLDLSKPLKNLDSIDRSLITDIVISSLTNHEYLVSDAIVQNLILHVFVSVQRMVSGNYITSRIDENINLDSDSIRCIAFDIYTEIEKHYPINATKEEHINLAIYLRGRRLYNDNQVVSKESDDFIYEMLSKIKENFLYDFTNDVNLRIDLALHLQSLIIRAKSNMLVSNQLIYSIQNSLLIEYNIATLARSLIEQHYNVVLNNDETGYLALYFSRAINELKVNNNIKKMLVVTALQTSEMLLLKHTLYKDFPDLISDITIVSQNNVTKEIFDESDVILTTGNFRTNLTDKEIIRINYFVTDEDRRSIHSALSRNSEPTLIKEFIDSSTFLPSLKLTSKESVVSEICKSLESDNNLSNKLYLSVMEREKYGSTAYLNGVAITHPLPLEDGIPRIGIAVLNENIVWEDNKTVKIIFLITGTNGVTGIDGIYELISKFMSDKHSIDRLINFPTFETFKNVFSKLS